MGADVGAAVGAAVGALAGAAVGAAVGAGVVVGAAVGAPVATIGVVICRQCAKNGTDIQRKIAMMLKKIIMHLLTVCDGRFGRFESFMVIRAESMLIYSVTLPAAAVASS